MTKRFVIQSFCYFEKQLPDTPSVHLHSPYRLVMTLTSSLASMNPDLSLSYCWNTRNHATRHCCSSMNSFHCMNPSPDRWTPGQGQMRFKVHQFDLCLYIYMYIPPPPKKVNDTVVRVLMISFYLLKAIYKQIL